jgi:thiamine biosynthesis lipoprotein
MRQAWILGLALTACRSHSAPYAARAHPVMDQVFSVGGWGGDSARLNGATAAAVDSARLLDSLVSPDRARSEVHRINQAAGRGPLPISKPLLTLLQQALEIARESAGALDPTGKDYRGVALDTVHGTVRLRTGLSLDLSGIARGFALDRGLTALDGIADSAILGIGGVLLVRAGAPLGPGRVVGISDPANSLRPLAQVELPLGTWAIATTAVTDADPVTDPRTGREAVRARSVTTIAKTAMQAAAWSRAFFVLGCDSALAHGPRLEVNVLCVDDRIRWTEGLNGRLTLVTDSARAAASGLAPGPARAPAPTPAAPGSRTRPTHSDSSQ